MTNVYSPNASTITGITPQIIDSRGRLYIMQVDQGAGDFSTNIYNDINFTNRVAYTANYSNVGSKVLIEDNGSGIGGTITVETYNVEKIVIVEFYRYGTLNTFGIYVPPFTPSAIASLGLWFESDETKITRVQPGIFDSTFTTGVGWTTEGSWSISGGKATHSNGDSLTVYQTPNPALIIGNLYSTQYTLLDYSAGTVRLLVGSGGVGTSQTNDGIKTENIKCASNTILYFDSVPSDSDFVGSVDNLIIENLSVSVWTKTDGYFETTLYPNAATTSPYWYSTGSDIVFSGAEGSEYFISDAVSIEQPNHIFIVTDITDTGFNQYMLDGGTTNSMGMIFITPGVGNPVFKLNAGTLSAGVMCQDSQLQIFEAVFNGASSKLAVDGAALTTVDAGVGNGDSLTIGVDGGVTTTPASMLCKEILLFTEELSTDDRTNVLQYLANKHGITLAA